MQVSKRRCVRLDKGTCIKQTGHLRERTGILLRSLPDFTNLTLSPAYVTARKASCNESCNDYRFLHCIAAATPLPASFDCQHRSAKALEAREDKVVLSGR